APSVRRRGRGAVACAGLAALVVVLFVLEVRLGDLTLSTQAVLDVLRGGGQRLDRFVVLQLRLPRALAAAAVGAAFGLAGALAQSVCRNPLASPDVLGVTAGASAAAVAALVLGGGTLAGLGLPVAALLGGLLAAVAIYLLAWRGGVAGLRLVLVGLGVAAALSAVTGWLLLRAELPDLASATRWITGSLNGVDAARVPLLAGALAVVLAGCAAGRRTLEVLRLDPATVRALGVRPQLAQGVLLLAAVVLASLATAVAGPVGFVAFVAPQLALRVCRSVGEPLLASALAGAALLLGSDLLGRVLLPVELPVGVVTSVLGAPCLLLLLVRRGRRGGA
ncbi:iron chelate uptake ABC transporter family permease subunit, partial [Kineococcus glutinatus]|uniref:iron chelate uptake ABC transporter family permease subunit n=1 Tax=Kineococcus glutinatus TaxID=1070872 RepID=UPI0031EEC091